MKANKKFQLNNNKKSAAVGMIGALVALLLMIIIGIMVFWETSDSIELSSAAANTSRDNVEDMATTVFDLLPIIALAVVASIIIGVIIGFGGGSGKL